MQVEWYGQSAFRLSAAGVTVAVDPFGDMSGLAARGVHFDYPPIRDLAVELVLVTHEHFDHNAADEFLAGMGAVQRLSSPAFDTEALDAGQAPAAVVPQAP